MRIVMIRIVYIYGPCLESIACAGSWTSKAYVVSFVSHVKDEVVADVEARIAAWTFLPVGMFFYLLVVTL